MKFQRNQSESFLLALLIRLQQRGDSCAPGIRQGGYTLVITIAVLLILSVLLLTFAITSKVDNASSNASAKGNTGFYAAEAGLNLRASKIRDNFVGYNRPSGTSPSDWKACISPTANKGTGDFRCETNTDISSQAVTTYIKDLTADGPVQVIIPEGETNEGLSAQEYRYNVVAVAQDKQNKPTSISEMRIKSRLIPLFQFAAFYNQDMDFQRPPDMTLNGRVHSNSDLYLNASDGGSLSIQGQVTAKGKLYRGEKVGYGCDGTVTIDGAASNPIPLNCPLEYDTKALVPWNGRVRVGVQPLKPPPPDDFNPTSGKLYWDSADLRIALDLVSNSIQIRDKNDVTDSGLSAQLNGSTCSPSTTLATANVGEKSLTVVSSPTNLKKGDIITLGSDPFGKLGSGGNSYVVADTYIPSATTIPITQPLTGSFTGAALRKSAVSFSDKTFKNYREKRGPKDRLDNTPIQMLNVDIDGVLGCAKTLMGKSLNDDSDGGLVWFLTVKGPDSAKINDYGIRIYNGRDLTKAIDGETLKGLSIISDQAVYVKGDYNCGTACTTATFDKPENDDQRKPAAVMADSINVLSNAWPLDDSWSDPLDLLRQISTSSSPIVKDKGRPATETTINAAFLAGNDAAEKGKIGTGGGLNNYPRFHEDWGNGYTMASSELIPFNYQGSLVSLSIPRWVNGAFCGSGSLGDCNIYNPPKRNWRYDIQFNDAANLPPMTPRVISLKQELFSRSFDQAALPTFTPWALLTPQRLFSTLGALMQPHP
jgi:Tfp pilus assembly protein PilX